MNIYVWTNIKTWIKTLPDLRLEYRCCWGINRDNPKSVITNWQLLVTNKFPGLISRWRHLWAWRNASPFTSWCKKKRKCWSLNDCWLWITWCKSVSMMLMTKYTSSFSGMIIAFPKHMMFGWWPKYRKSLNSRSVCFSLDVFWLKWLNHDSDNAYMNNGKMNIWIMEIWIYE